MDRDICVFCEFDVESMVCGELARGSKNKSKIKLLNIGEAERKERDREEENGN